ncbi:MAG: HEAT repeat domain-containing protein [Dehalococcoidia bacterium]|nr:HEAT repeat domain-containing protein [Dehalococcoidia bacterium]
MEFTEYLEELKDGATRLKVSSLARLSDLSSEQAETFARAWPGIDARRRRRVVQEMVDISEDNVDLSFDAVFFRTLEDEDAAVRLQSVRGLWEYEKLDLIEALLRLLRGDADAAVRAEAALNLGRYVLLSEHGRLSEPHFQRVEAGLRRALADAAEVAEVRARALEAIGPYDSPWVRQAIREAYESGVRRLKASAVHAMGRSCEARWLPLLTRELMNEENEIRYEAAVACGWLSDERAVQPLVRLLSEPDEEIRGAAISALGEIGGREAKNALLELADDHSPATRAAALAALAGIDFEEDPLALRHRIQ